MPSLLRSARSTGIIAGIILAVLIATGLMLAFTHSKSAARQQRLVVANYETMALMREMVIAVQDAEIGLRGFLLTGDVTSLELGDQRKKIENCSTRNHSISYRKSPPAPRQRSKSLGLAKRLLKVSESARNRRNEVVVIVAFVVFGTATAAWH